MSCLSIQSFSSLPHTPPCSGTSRAGGIDLPVVEQYSLACSVIYTVASIDRHSHRLLLFSFILNLVDWSSLECPGCLDERKGFVLSDQRGPSISPALTLIRPNRRRTRTVLAVRVPSYEAISSLASVLSSATETEVVVLGQRGQSLGN